MTPREESMARHPAGKRGNAPLPGPHLAVVEHPSVPPEENPPRLPDVATVTVKTKPVDGTKKKRTRGKGKGRRSSVTEHVKVDPRIMAVVKQVKSKGIYTKVQIVDAETVIVR